ncbi:MBL fold metallo-hydrolase [Tianweitania populi]|uniref:Zn-dependent hydrolase n=1 Tax=Tianweitania populi TaxID=1607949 RepID=A0A8J3GKF6_9HYPH|nr:MBL fold metallo-hydrolase [Tianweitania populi]GHD16967.1 Zn-dependent hydrolase [Tianweitania populi]
MLIRKFIHSCLVLEKDGTKVLIDPGFLSFIEDRVNVADFEDVRQILITHTHPDHLDVAALKAIVRLSGAEVTGNAEVAARLAEEGMVVARVIGDGDRFSLGAIGFEAITVKHEDILDDSLPEVTAFVIDDRILHVVDSFDPRLADYKGMDLLILPVTAPFLTETSAYAFARDLKPKAVLGVHEGYCRDFFIKARHQTYAKFLARDGIAFHSLIEAGDGIEV